MPPEAMPKGMLSDWLDHPLSGMIHLWSYCDGTPQFAILGKARPKWAYDLIVRSATAHREATPANFECQTYRQPSQPRVEGLQSHSNAKNNNA